MPVNASHQVTSAKQKVAFHPCRPINSTASSPAASLPPPSWLQVLLSSLTAKFFSCCPVIFSLIHPFLLPNALSLCSSLWTTVPMAKFGLLVSKPYRPLHSTVALAWKFQEGREGTSGIYFELRSCLHFLLLPQRRCVSVLQGASWSRCWAPELCCFQHIRGPPSPGTRNQLVLLWAIRAHSRGFPLWSVLPAPDLRQFSSQSPCRCQTTASFLVVESGPALH